MIEPVLSDDAFIADVESARGAPGVHLWWLGQSGFLVQWDTHHLLIDPYLSDSLTEKYANTPKPHIRMTRRVVAPERLWFVDLITSSHAHTDHLDAKTIRPIRQTAYARSPVPHIVRLHAPAAAHEVTEERWGDDYVMWCDDRQGGGDPRTGAGIYGVAAAHPDFDRDSRGRCPYLGYIFRLGSLSVYHSGDTIVYPELAEHLARHDVDVAILPINGKVGNMGGADAARLAHDIGAKLVIPCHYEMFEFNTADPRDEFIPECERLGQPYKLLRAGERLTLSARD